MSESKSMYELSAEHARLAVIAGLGFDPETAEAFDPEEIDKAFDALEDKAEAKITAAGYVSCALQDDIDALDKWITRLTVKRNQKKTGRKRLIERMRWFMDTTGLTKVETNALTVTLGKASKRVQIGKRLARKWWTKPEPAPNKVAIATALKAGVKIRGAKLVDGIRSLTIR